MSSNQLPMPFGEELDWEELSRYLDQASQSPSPTNSVLHQPLQFDPNWSQLGGYGTPTSVPVAVVTQPVMWSGRSNMSNYNAHHQPYYNYNSAVAGHVVHVPSGTRIMNGPRGAIARQPVMSPTFSYGNAPLLSWCPSPSSAQGEPSWPSFSFNDVAAAAPVSGSFTPTTTVHTQSTPVAVASTSSAKIQAPRSRPSSKNAAKPGTSKTGRVMASKAPVPAQEPRNEDADGNELPPPKKYLHERDPAAEPDPKERARIRRAKKCKQFRDEREKRAVCQGCLAKCGGDMRTYKRIKSLLKYHNKHGYPDC